MSTSSTSRPLPAAAETTAAETIDRVVRLGVASGHPSSLLTQIAGSAPTGWADGAEDAELLEDLILVSRPLDANAIRVQVRASTSDRGSWELAVVARNRRGALATSCRVLSDERLSIQSARISSWIESELALQCFNVRPLNMPLSGEPDWPPITLAVRAALLKDDPFDKKIAAKLREDCKVETVTVNENQVHVRFRAPDVPGLLSEITTFLSASGADIHSSHVRTNHGVAVDDFIITFAESADFDRLRAVASPSFD